MILTCHFINENSSKSFIGYYNAVSLLGKIRNGKKNAKKGKRKPKSN